MKINWKPVRLFLSGLFFFSASHASALPSKKMDVKVIKLRNAIKKKIEAGESSSIINYISLHHHLSNGGNRIKGQWDSWDSWNNWDAWNNWDTWSTWDTWNTWDSWDAWNNWDTWNTWDSWNSWGNS